MIILFLIVVGPVLVMFVVCLRESDDGIDESLMMG